MKILRTILLAAILAISISSLCAQEALVTKSDIAKLIGNWEGSLMYLDYSSNQPYTMPCNAIINSVKNKNQVKVSYEYPNEPKANRTFKLKISKDGTEIGKEKITNKTLDEEGNSVFEIVKSGKDGNDNKQALIRQTYVISDQVFIVRKEVKFDGTTEWVLRNEYKFTKAK